MIRRWLRRGLLMLGCVCVILGIAYGGMIGYIAYRERVSPSTQQVLVLNNGQEIPLIQPASVAVDMAVVHTENGDEQDDETGAAPSRATPPLLPPDRIIIPGIEVDWPVVLSTNDHLPQFKGVGWLMGSAFPGAPGNMVLFGHLGGEHGTFMRLHELKQGDEFSVVSGQTTHRYRVGSSYETTRDDVAVLAPTETATVTLITCSGPWDPIAQTNERRWIIEADYIGH